jgi:hypothetical protein
MSSTGTCGYDIACTGDGSSECSPDGRAIYECNAIGHFVEKIVSCDTSGDPSQICWPSTPSCGYDIPCATDGCSPDGRAIYFCDNTSHFVGSIYECGWGQKCAVLQEIQGIRDSSSVECR